MEPSLETELTAMRVMMTLLGGISDATARRRIMTYVNNWNDHSWKPNK